MAIERLVNVVVIFLMSMLLEEQLIHGQDEMLDVVEVPTCSADQFLTSNGTDIFCTTLPDVGFCDCPDLVPDVGSGEPVQTFPLPPPGCEQFKPPIRGAFVCLRKPSIIYCSVLCDHRFEFSSTPVNPYFCGEETGFLWKNGASANITDGLPNCTGYRHRSRSLFPHSLYLPAPCYGLTDNTIFHVLKEFEIKLKKVGCEDFNLEDAFIRCPKVPASATFLRDLTVHKVEGH